jgi:hypothetical protein
LAVGQLVRLVHTGAGAMLSDGDKQYLVGHDTLGWEDGAGSWTYAVPDALGSVR